MTIRRHSCIVSQLVLTLGLALGCRAAPTPAAPSEAPRPVPAVAPGQTVTVRDIGTGVGFSSPRRLADHFRKHGAEFEGLTQADYLRAAQTLRDRPLDGAVLELARSDRTVSRYDRKTGTFLAFDVVGTIRTFFKPSDGEAYFRRQARRRQQ